MIHKFLDKNANMFNLLGFRQICLDDRILPDVLKARSDAECVAQLHRYFFANILRTGQDSPCCLHHSNGSEPASRAENMITFVTFSLAETEDGG